MPITSSPFTLQSGWEQEHVSAARGEDQPVFHYPAMMVSPMQGALLDAVIAQRGGGRDHLVLDCFVGSGTTMIEARRRGLRFVGLDINPLAILISRVEAAEADPSAAEVALFRAHRRAARNVATTAAPTDRWAVKWFRPDVAVQLAALRDAIRSERSASVRRVLWVALCEVARRSGNHRIEAPKLQTRPVGSLARPIDVLGDFRRTGSGIVATVARRADAAPATEVRLVLGDARRDLPAGVCADILLTSPPYGANHTTMPYGQVSFLPLAWVDVEDIDPACDRDLLSASKTLDTASLGGSQRVDRAATAAVIARSPALAATLKRIKRRKREGWAYTASFFTDVAEALEQASGALAPDAHAVLTLGDKTTYGVPVPTAAIVRELLEADGYDTLEVLKRRIGRNKRMPRRTRQAKLISSETVLVMRRRA